MFLLTSRVKWKSVAPGPVCRARTEGDALIVDLAGNIERHNSRQLHDELLGLIDRHSPRRLILNLKQVLYMDSTGCAALVAAVRRIRIHAGEVRLVGLQPRVRGMIEITKIGPLFTIADDEGLMQGVSDSVVCSTKRTPDSPTSSTKQRPRPRLQVRKHNRTAAGRTRADRRRVSRGVGDAGSRRPCGASSADPSSRSPRGERNRDVAIL